MKVWTLVVGGIATNCYIAADEETREAAVIDPGDDAQRILELLRENALTPRYIFLTHGHFDHILAVPELKKETGAQIVIHEADAPCLTDASLSLGPYRRGGQGVPADIRAVDGQAFSLGALTFTFMHTPGHTRGSCVIVCGDVIFSGDTLFCGECGRCDLPGGSYPAMLASLKRLSGLAGDYHVYPGHDAQTTLEAERRTNPYMREAMGE